MRVLQRAWLVPVVIFLSCWAMTTHGKYSDSGDEPHYLIVTQSLVADGDLDVGNNYAGHQGSHFGADDLEAGPHVQATIDGRAFPVHDIGLSVLLVPAYVVATTLSSLPRAALLHRFRMTPGLFAYSLISLVMLGMTTAAAVMTRSALIADGTSASLASAIVLATWLAPPTLSNGFLVFPEVIALVVTAWTIKAAIARPPRPASMASLAACALALGLLPWFHRKYLPYAAGLLIVLLWDERARFTAAPRATRVAIVALFALPPLALAWWTWTHWANLGGPLTIGGAPFSWTAFRAGSLGLLIDRENGLFVWAPIYLLLPAACALAGRRRWIWLLPAVLLFVASAAHDQWWGGFSPAGRFLVPLVPIFALIGARALRFRAVRVTAVALLVPQILVSAYGWQHTRALWPQGDGDNRVVGALLHMFGIGQTWLPSLRAVPAAEGAALAALVAIVLANVVVWTIAKRDRTAPAAQ